jgi:hypothetical protein
MLPIKAMRLRSAAAIPFGPFWNPLDKGPNVVLSNSNLTATKAAAGFQTVRGCISKSSGKRYFEINVVVASSSPTGILAGVADAGMALTVRYLGEANAGAKKSTGRWNAGFWYRNLTNTGGFIASTTFGAGDVVGMEVDFAAFTIKLYNGLTGAQVGVTFTDATPWPALYPAMTMQGGGSGTLNSSGPFAFLPAGAVPWDDP